MKHHNHHRNHPAAAAALSRDLRGGFRHYHRGQRRLDADRLALDPDNTPDNAHDHEAHGRHGRRGHRGGGRIFDYGELRLLVLAMIADRSRHGYELIKAIEERMGGRYTPSPGVMYPTLSWLEDMNYAAVVPEEGGRKRYVITEAGRQFVIDNQSVVEGLFARIGNLEPKEIGKMPAPIIRGMENLKLALKLRMQDGPIDRDVAAAIAAALDAAAQAVERS